MLMPFRRVKAGVCLTLATSLMTVSCVGGGGGPSDARSSNTGQSHDTDPSPDTNPSGLEVRFRHKRTLVPVAAS